ncbi:MAG: DNA helicase RecQ [Candidatus Brocadiaceae bacterium]|nr:DNA helicase RecQ [Candidatus Brocadiaceae bacterium]
MYNTLQKFFGYTNFYPLQEDIIKEALNGRDAFVLMPTGGGKSLCYQLPALLLEGVTVVISPLIALMKDQVDGLIANGIPATFINSSLTSHETNSRKERLLHKEIKILYLAPERLFMTDFFVFLQKLDVSLFAIDESHCISEWGHDFRPEYRQLSLLKQTFPNTPVMALTATATPVVQNDILSQLKLTGCKVFTASFNRKNLFYAIRHKENAYHHIVQYITRKKNDSGIIYCQSRKTVESLASNLLSEGFRALPYHAGLSSEERTKNQERFIREDVDIIVATIAFGMGIDKSNVRYVIHYDLPKSIEGYYQETGRAGRDGIKSDCILFFSYGDKIKIEYFIKQKTDERERQLAFRQLRELIQYCEGAVCRRKLLLSYFGEHYEEQNCRSCDICLEPKEKIDATIQAQKILSCVYRVHERFGIHYIVDVLLGAKNQRILQNRHDTLTTFGIGKESAKSHWQTFIRELIQLDYLRMEGDTYPVLKLTEKSKPVLLKNEKVFLTRPEKVLEKRKDEGRREYDNILFELLKTVRKTIADRESVPPYIIFHDTSLKEMATQYPQNLQDLRSINGVGEQKLKKYGEAFLQNIIDYCKEHSIQPKQQHSTNYQQSPMKQMKTPTTQITLELCRQNLSIEEIAKKRGLAPSTIVTHLEKLMLEGEDISVDRFINQEKQQHIHAAFHKLGLTALTPVKELLGDDFSYEEIRLVRAKMQQSKIG